MTAQWQDIQTAIAIDPRLNDSERRILLFIHANGRAHGWGAKSNPDTNAVKSLAVIIGLSYDTTRRNVQRLIKKGMLTREVRRGHEEIVFTDQFKYGSFLWLKECRMYLGYDRWASLTDGGHTGKDSQLMQRLTAEYFRICKEEFPGYEGVYDDGGSTQGRKARWKQVFDELL